MKMTGVDRLFVDTNVLIYATNESSPWRALAKAALQEARQLGIELIVSTQVLREYLAAATRLSGTGNGIPLANIFENLQTFQREFTVLEDTQIVLATLVNLARSVSVAGKQRFTTLTLSPQCRSTAFAICSPTMARILSALLSSSLSCHWKTVRHRNRRA